MIRNGYVHLKKNIDAYKIHNDRIHLISIKTGICSV